MARQLDATHQSRLSRVKATSSQLGQNSGRAAAELTGQDEVHPSRLVGRVGPAVDGAALDAHIPGFHMNDGAVVQVTAQRNNSVNICSVSIKSHREMGIVAISPVKLSGEQDSEVQRDRTMHRLIGNQPLLHVFELAIFHRTALRTVTVLGLKSTIRSTRPLSLPKLFVTDSAGSSSPWLLAGN